MFPNTAATLRRIPVDCFWELTEACNLRCRHCEASAGQPAPAELSAEEALRVCRDIAELGCKNVHLTGGEPLLRPDWDVIARRLVALDLNVSVITNGLLVHPATVCRMVSAGVTGLSVSLDGTRETHDALRASPNPNAESRYDQALAAIRLGVASSMKTAVITQIHRQNLEELEELYELMKALGVKVWQVQLCMPLGRMLSCRDEYLVLPEQLGAIQAKLASFIHEGRLRIAVGDNIGYYGTSEPALRGAVRDTKSFWLGCLAGCRAIALRANGDVKGCPSHPVSLVVGNLRQTPLRELWSDPTRFSYNTGRDAQLLAGACLSCPFGQLCRAGCKSMALATSGSLSSNPYCVQAVRLAATVPVESALGASPS
jgi:radical SAM protein with 4Fe4S-binding SPASM domain